MQQHPFELDVGGNNHGPSANAFALRLAKGLGDSGRDSSLGGEERTSRIRPCNADNARRSQFHHRQTPSSGRDHLLSDCSRGHPSSDLEAHHGEKKSGSSQMSSRELAETHPRSLDHS